MPLAVLLPPRPRAILAAPSPPRPVPALPGDGAAQATADPPRAGPAFARAGEGGSARFTILIVDDDTLMTDMLPRRLRRVLRGGVEIFTASSAHEALELMRTARPDVVLSDYNLREARTGLDVLGDARSLAPEAVRILFSGHSSGEISSLGEAPIHAFLEKPMRLDELVDRVLDVIRRERGVDLRTGGSA